MLQNIRDRSQGWLAGVIVAFITVPFALWGVNSYLSASDPRIVADVEGYEVGVREFEGFYQQYRNQLAAYVGGVSRLDQLDQTKLKSEALDQLVDFLLIGDVAHDVRMRISDRQVLERIHNTPAFLEDDKFSKKTYEQRLQFSGMSSAAYEAQMQSDMLNQQLRQGITDSEFITDQELKEIARLQDQKRNIAYATLSAETLGKDIDPSDEEIEEYYQANKKAYKTKEQVKVAYIELAIEDLAKEVTVDYPLLREYYESNSDDYTVAEQRSADHIVVAAPVDAKEKAVDKAIKQVEAYIKLAKDGKSLKEIAEKDLEKAGSEVEYNQTGLLQRGVMEPAFDEVMFTLEKGQVSKPVRTKFGIHVLQVTEIKTSRTQSFDEAKEELEKSYRREQAEEKYYDYGEQLANLVYENPDTLEIASEELGLPIKQSEFFVRSGGEGITKESKFIAAAFSDDVLQEGLNSELTELGAERQIVLRLEEHKPVEQKALSDVCAEIEKTLTEKQAKELAEKQGTELLTLLKEGKDRDTVVKQSNIEWKKAEGVGRSSADVNQAILRAAFKMTKPEADKPVYNGVQLGTGDYALVCVLEVKDPDSLDDKALKETRKNLLATRGSAAWEDFLSGLKDRSDIELYEENI